MRNPCRRHYGRGDLHFVTFSCYLGRFPRQIILGDVPHSFRMPFFRQKKMRNTRNRSTCLVVT